MYRIPLILAVPPLTLAIATAAASSPPGAKPNLLWLSAEVRRPEPFAHSL